MGEPPCYQPFLDLPSSEHLWTLHKDGVTISAEMRADEQSGVMLQLSTDRDLVYRHRCDNRARALDESRELRHEYESKGWKETARPIPAE